MRIVNRKEFLALPKGTLYSRYKPSYFEGLEIKLDSLVEPEHPELSGDWFYLDLIGNVKNNGDSDLFSILDAAEDEGKPFELCFDTYGRDGLFEEDQLFAVYTFAEMHGLIETIKQASSLASSDICVNPPSPHPGTAA